jgi:hypothetical protein
MTHIRINSTLRHVFVFVLTAFASAAMAQYAPPAGMPGSTAMHKDSTAFLAWAANCTVTRGPQEAGDPSKGLASAGDASMAAGKADGSVVSLGDGGVATCTFEYPIINGIGADFAVFENAITDAFLELAFVEVSSDGVNFFRFRSHSLTDTTTQTGSFGETDTKKVNNLAGKFRAGYGTPFDLEELSGQQGLDVNAVTHVRIKDAVGSMNNSHASRDGYNNKVNDPWPTPFPTSGFDLDAVGVIHHASPVGVRDIDRARIAVFENPLKCGEAVEVKGVDGIISLQLCSFSGEVLRSSEGSRLETEGLSPGMYLLRIRIPGQPLSYKLILY